MLTSSFDLQTLNSWEWVFRVPNFRAEVISSINFMDDFLKKARQISVSFVITSIPYLIPLHYLSSTHLYIICHVIEHYDSCTWRGNCFLRDIHFFRNSVWLLMRHLSVRVQMAWLIENRLLSSIVFPY